MCLLACCAPEPVPIKDSPTNETRVEVSASKSEDVESKQDEIRAHFTMILPEENCDKIEREFRRIRRKSVLFVEGCNTNFIKLFKIPKPDAVMMFVSTPAWTDNKSKLLKNFWILYNSSPKQPTIYQFS